MTCNKQMTGLHVKICLFYPSPLAPVAGSSVCAQLLVCQDLPMSDIEVGAPVPCPTCSF